MGIPKTSSGRECPRPHGQFLIPSCLGLSVDILGTLWCGMEVFLIFHNATNDQKTHIGEESTEPIDPLSWNSEQRSMFADDSDFTGYIGEFEVIDDHRGGKVVIQLNGRLNKTGVISPRFNVAVDSSEWLFFFLLKKAYRIITDLWITIFSPSSRELGRPIAPCPFIR